MRIRAWIFAALVVLMLAANLALVSLRIAQTGEDTVRARVALASTALRAQLELLDARQNPRLLSGVPELVEATRAPLEAGPSSAVLSGLPQPRPDERALRAAAGALQPEPDLVAVVNAHGAVVARRSRPVQLLDDPALLPLARASLEGSPSPIFATYDGATYRLSAARIAGNPASVVVGALVDDRLAMDLRSQVDADVTLLHGNEVLASSLAKGDERARLSRWAAQPGQGFGLLPVRLPLLDYKLTGHLPLWSSRVAMRGALVPLDGGLQAAVTVPASPYFGWLARYQAFYLGGLALFVLFSIGWFLLPRAPAAAPAVKPAPARRSTPAETKAAPAPTVIGTDVTDARVEPKPRPRDVPWSAGEGPSGEHPMPFPGRPPAPPPVTQPLLTKSHADDAEEPGTKIASAAPEEVEEVEEVEEASEAGDPWAAPPAVPLPGTEASGGDDWASAASAPATAGEEWGAPAAPAAAPEDDWATASAPPSQAPTAPPSQAPTAPPPAAPAPKGGDFSFEGLLEDGQAGSGGNGAPAKGAKGEETARLFGGIAAGGARAAEKPAPAEEHFPGDEPTRIEPVSAALLDKLREKDEELARAARSAGEGAPPPPAAQPRRAPEPLDPDEPAQPAAAAHPEPAEPEAAEPEAAEPEADPDLQHWRETFEKFLALKQDLGEPAGALSFEKFSARLRKNREDLLAKHQAKGVRFVVYEKDGKAAIKASAIR